MGAVEPLEDDNIGPQGRLFNISCFAVISFLLILTQYLLLVRYRRHQIFLVRFPKVFWLDTTLNFLNGAVKRIPIIDQIVYVLGCVTAPGEFFRYYNREERYSNKNINDVVPLSADSSSSQEEKNADLRRQLTIRKVGFCRRLINCNGFTRYLFVNICWYIIAALLTMNFTTLHGLHSHATSSNYASPTACWSAYLFPMQVGFYYGYTAVYVVILIAISQVQDRVGLRDDIALSLVIGVGFKFANGFLHQFWTNSWVYTYSPAATAPPLISMIVLLIYIRKMDLNKHLHGKGNANFLAMSSDSMDEVLATRPADTEVIITRVKENRIRNMNALICSKESSKNNLLKSTGQPTRMERYWNIDDGKKIIEELGKKFFVHESIRFLSETDDLLLDRFPMEDILLEHNSLPAVGKKHVNNMFVPYMKLFETFIEANSPWEVNISSKIREQYASLLTEMEDDGDPQDNINALIDLIIVIRREIFVMIDPILRTHLKQQYQHHLKATASDGVVSV